MVGRIEGSEPRLLNPRPTVSGRRRKKDWGGIRRRYLGTRQLHRVSHATRFLQVALVCSFFLWLLNQIRALVPRGLKPLEPALGAVARVQHEATSAANREYCSASPQRGLFAAAGAWSLCLCLIHASEHGSAQLLRDKQWRAVITCKRGSVLGVVNSDR